MNINELRIGNLVYYNWTDNPEENLMVLTGRDIYDISDNPEFFELFEPVPLTEEWLIKLGFEKFSSTQYDRNDFWWIQKVLDGAYEGMFYITYLEKYIKYVHQLQNIYLDLTGKELKYNKK